MRRHTRRLLRGLTAFFCLALPACRPGTRHIQPAHRVSVQIVSDEADAALDILQRRLRLEPISDSTWQRLFQSEGYQDLKRRELGMRRAFSDSAFRAFLLSDSLLGRTASLRTALEEYRRIDIVRSAARALAYLPPASTIRARLYLEIKPRTNSFVYPVPSGSAIFLYVDPSVPRERAEHDIVTHELHHIGIRQSCRRDPAEGSSPAATARAYAGGLHEGLAMLAAAGGVQADPHAASPAATRQRWERDLAQWPHDLRRIERFLLAVGEGKLTNADSIAAAAAPFWGDAQGPWYTVGYAVTTTIERRFGRDALRRVVCDPAAMLAAYNAAVRADKVAGSIPLWSERLLTILRR